MFADKDRLSPTTRYFLNVALVDYAYQQNTIGIVVSLLCATVLVFIAYPFMAKSILAAWYLLFVLITILRYMLIVSYKKKKDNSHIILWRNLFIIGACLGAINWGLSGAILLPRGASLQQAVQVLVLAGVTAGAVPLYSGVLISAILFLIIALLPLIINLLTSNANDFIFLGITVSFYLIYLVLLSIKQRNLIENLMRLRYANEGLVRDLLKTKQQLEVINQKLQQTATHDPLTGLANRSLFRETLEQTINRAERQKHIFALFYLDLDGFKKINDTFGHHMGDVLLLLVAKRLKIGLRESDVIARLGGDEFAVILEDVGRVENIIQVAKNLIHILGEPYTLDQTEVKITVSLGISLYSMDGHDVDSLVSSADRAMYYAKQHGTGNYHFSSEL